MTNQTNFEFTNFKMPTANLPAALKALVKMTGKRPQEVDVYVSTGPTIVNEGYATMKIVSLGKQVTAVDASYVGSDGEPNHVTAITYDAPAAYVLGFGKGKRVRLVLGNVSEGLVLSLNKNKDETDALQSIFQNALLAVATDAALGG